MLDGVEERPEHWSMAWAEGALTDWR
jgi:hypothetical protein